MVQSWASNDAILKYSATFQHQFVLAVLPFLPFKQRRGKMRGISTSWTKVISSAANRLYFQSAFDYLLWRNKAQQNIHTDNVKKCLFILSMWDIHSDSIFRVPNWLKSLTLKSDAIVAHFTFFLCIHIQSFSWGEL